MKIFNIKTNTLLFRNFISYLLIAVGVLACFAVLIFVQVSQIIKSVDNDYNDRIFQLVSERIETHIQGIEQFTLVPYINENQELLKQIVVARESSYDSLAFYNTKSRFFQNFSDWILFLNNHKEIQRVFLVTESGVGIERGQSTFLTDYSFLENALYQKALASGGKPVYQIGKEEYAKDYSGKAAERFLMIARKINVSGTNGKNIVLFLVIGLEEVNRIVQDVMEKDLLDFFILDEDQEIIYATRQGNTELAENYRTITNRLIVKYNKQNLAIAGHDFTYTGWKFLTISSTENIRGLNYILLKSFSGFVAIAIVLAFILSYIFSRYIFKPINQLVGYTHSIREGDFEHTIQVEGPEEILLLSDAMNAMTRELRRMIQRNYILTIQQKEARLSALQAQINPHFLYNTLNTISMSAELSDLHEIARATQSLSDMFRYNIQNTKDLVSIKKELEHVHNYIRIQNLRYDNMIQCHVDIEPELLQTRIIKFVLQPLVENSVIHGMSGEKPENHIYISASEDGGDIILTVCDNGHGIDEDKLRSINETLSQDDWSISGESQRSSAMGIGLLNVHDRLRLYYGEEYGIWIESIVDVGTQVHICIKRE